MQGNSSVNDQSFTAFRTPQQLKWEDPSLIEYSTRLQSSLSKLNQPPENSSLLNGMSNNQLKITNQEDIPMNPMLGTDRTQVWNPRAVLSNLIFLEQKIHQLQELVHMLVEQKGHVPGNQDEVVTQQQQLITADVTSIVIQLISTAGSLLPSVKQNPSAATTSAVQLNALLFPSHNNGGQVQQSTGDVRSSEKSKQMDVNGMTYCNMEEDHELKDDGDGKEEHLPPGSYEILQLEKEEILAPHTHFCTICGKGFKRDANLRMHMRGHGDEYKTPAALAKPNKESSSKHVLLNRYSCPFVGCKRNKDHKTFQPLKTILCVKNHYKRTHCDELHL